jgi:hypothetical protein
MSMLARDSIGIHSHFLCLCFVLVFSSCTKKNWHVSWQRTSIWSCLGESNQSVEYFVLAHERYYEWGAFEKCDSLSKFVVY